MTKLQLGHAPVLEALLPERALDLSARSKATPTKQSFADKRVPKLELGNENKPNGRWKMEDGKSPYAGGFARAASASGVW